MSAFSFASILGKSSLAAEDSLMPEIVAFSAIAIAIITIWIVLSRQSVVKLSDKDKNT